MKLVFENVGRGQWNGSIDIPDNSTPNQVAEFAYREARRHLITRFPMLTYDANANEGVITAGFHNAGKFHTQK